MKVLETNTIYKNLLPQLCSRHSFFPFLAQLYADGVKDPEDLAKIFDT